MTHFHPDLPSRRKVALVIGNDDYQRPENKLCVARSNARRVADALETIHFDVTQHADCAKDMMHAIKDFGNEIQDGDLVLFYFCGHGCHIDGKNYLIPAEDGLIETKRDVIDLASSVDSILLRFGKPNSSYATVMILDCFRSYMLHEASSSSSSNCEST